MTRLLIPSLVIIACSSTAEAQIYADFETSMGNFTCELNYTAAPKTVANFVGLATGERNWLDYTTGKVVANTPFYDGLIFHRVIKDFMNQSGSRNGQGTDGPGYQFPDETSNDLTHLPYVISMANSGTYTNGSQFFITTVATDWLDDQHTIFGAVTAGTSVVNAINQVATTSSRPNVPVVIHHVTIRREGSAANAFDIHAQGLPVVSNIACDLNVSFPSKVDAVPRQARPAGSVTSVFFSEDLTAWENSRTATLEAGAPSPAPFEIYTPTGFATSIAEKGFFRFSRTDHPDILKPQSYAGRTLSVSWSGQTITFNFNAAGDGGSATYSNDPPGTTRDIIEIHDFASPYDMVIELDYFGALKVSADRTDENATHFLGNHKLSQWGSGAWNYIGGGSMTLSK